MKSKFILIPFFSLLITPIIEGSPPSTEEVKTGLRKGIAFFATKVAVNGGYVWKYSPDLKYRQGEGLAGKTKIWVQPPGTPTVGDAFLDAYQATGNKSYLNAAIKAGKALVKGQLRTGGWFYYIETDSELRKNYGYRDVPIRRKQPVKSTLDDDVTQAAIRFLIRLDNILEFKDKLIHEASIYALNKLVKAQYPNGGWYMWWDREPQPKNEDDYPKLRASYPKTWSRKWLNDWTGKYYINDRVIPNVIRTLIEAGRIYDKGKYRKAAIKGGDFLVLAQMPEPQPGWAQQYNIQMHPVWDRRFEPPAITGMESQSVMETLLLLYGETGEKKFLEPIPRALKYYRNSLLPNGKLARFYELKTNRPLFFRRTGRTYHLTYNPDQIPDHYAFYVTSKLDRIEREYQRLKKSGRSPKAKVRKVYRRPQLEKKVRKIIENMDERGAWLVKDYVRDNQGRKVNPPEGIIMAETFVHNVTILCRYLEAKE